MPVKLQQSSFRDRTPEFLNVAERLKKSFSSTQNGANSASKADANIKHAYIRIVLQIKTFEILRILLLGRWDLQLLSNSRNESGSGNISNFDDLKTADERTKDNLKVHENRRQLFSTASKDLDILLFVRQRPLATRSAASASASPPPWANGSSSSQLFPRKQIDGESQPLIQQQQQQQQQLVPLQDSYMQSRAEALQNVESTIHELSSIFNQLATLVSQQGELAIRIDENMDDTLANVEGAQGALLKYLHSISSNRWLMIKIFFVLIFFLMVFLFFVA
ncbi:hypothetical protein AAG906_031016 [Vitis piasezkii]